MIAVLVDADRDRIGGGDALDELRERLVGERKAEAREGGLFFEDDEEGNWAPGRCCWRSARGDERDESVVQGEVELPERGRLAQHRRHGERRERGQRRRDEIPGRGTPACHS